MGKQNSDKPVCKYGAGCYRKNPQHLKDYSHPCDTVEQKCESHSEKSPPAKRKKTIDQFFKTSKDKEEARKNDKAQDGNKNSKLVESTEDGVLPTEKDSEAISAQPSTSKTGLEDREEKSEEIINPPSPADIKENIKQKFLVEMPQDFYDLWEFAETLDSKNPSDAFLSSLGLQLVGPYDVLSGKSSTLGHGACWLRHWRYFYDPPEFLTVIRGDDESLFHFGYFRDDPNEMPVFVATNAAKENCNIRPRGENIFAALLWFIDDKMRKEKDRKDKLTKLKAKLREFAETKKHPLESKTKKMTAREKKVVTRTFHAAGLVVPVDDAGVGYRELPETDADLKKMFKKIAEAETEKDRDLAFDPLMEVIMLVQFANDECDYGEGLELGLDMFSSGHKVLHSQVLNLMPLAYELLNRQAFSDIIKAHLEDRQLTAHLSQLKTN